MTDSVSIRLGTTGGKEVVDQFRQIGKTSEEEFRKTGEAATKAERGLKAYADSVKGVATRLQELKANAASKAAFAQGQFSQGQATGLGDLGQQVLNAGGLRNFVAAAGGPLGAAALAGGVVHSQINQFAQLGDAAEKARLTAQEMQGLQKIMSEVGLTSADTDRLFGALGQSILKARQEGAQLAVDLNNADGTAKGTLQTFSEFASAIRNAASEEEKMRLATQAVGSELASSFVQAATSAVGAMGNLQGAARQAGSSFANDLAAGAKVAIGWLNALGKEADQAYAKLKVIGGMGSQADKLKAAEFDTRRAGEKLAELENNRGPAKKFNDFFGDTEEAARQNLIEKADRAARLREELGSPPAESINDRLGFRNRGYMIDKTRPVQGPPAPPVRDDEEPTGGRRGGGGKAAAAAAGEEETAYDRVTASLANLRAQLGMTERQRFIFGQQQQLGKDASEQDRAAIEAQAGAYFDLKKSMDAAAATQQQLAQGFQQVGQSLLQGALSGQKFSQILKSLLSQFASRGLNNILGSLFSGGGGGGGFLSSLFGGGGSGPLQLAGAGSGIPSFTGFAGLFDAGGSIPAGQWGIAGERRPELVVGPATVVPQGKLGGLGGGGVVVNNYGADVATRQESGVTIVDVRREIGQHLDRYDSGLLSNIQEKRARAP